MLVQRQFRKKPAYSSVIGSRTAYLVEKFNPDEPRDESGRWTSEGGGPHSDAINAGKNLEATAKKDWFYRQREKVVENLRAERTRLETENEGLQAQFDAAIEREDTTTANEIATKMDAYITNATENQVRLDRAERDLRYKFDSVIGSSLNPSTKLDGEMRNLDTNAFSGASSALGWYSSKIGDGGVSQSNWPVFDHISTPRAYQEGRQRIAAPEGMSTATGIHEMGHWLESNRSDVHEAAVSFLEDRWQSAVGSKQDMQQLSKLQGSEFYQPHEIAFKDEFSNAYVGKIYASGRVITATEVVSMGMENLYRDAAGFKKSDPEHYYFTLGILKQVSSGPDRGSPKPVFMPAQMGDSVFYAYQSARSKP